MSIHRSLRISGGHKRTRNVLRRVERLAVLKEQAHWDESQSVYGLPKVRTQFKSATAKKKKKKEEEKPEAEAGENKEASSSSGSSS